MKISNLNFIAVIGIILALALFSSLALVSSQKWESTNKIDKSSNPGISQSNSNAEMQAIDLILNDSQNSSNNSSSEPNLTNSSNNGTINNNSSNTSLTNSTGENLTLDLIPPLVIINSPLSGEVYSNSSVIIDFSLNEPGDCSYSLSGQQNLFDMTGSQNRTSFRRIHNFLTSGEYTLVARCEDDAGNANNGESVQFKVNLTQESNDAVNNWEMQIISPVNAVYSSSTLDLKISFNSSGSCSYSLNGNANKTLSYTNQSLFVGQEINLISGTYQLDAFCWPLNSTKSIKKSVTFSVNISNSGISSPPPSNNDRGSRASGSSSSSSENQGIVVLENYEKNYTNCQTRWACSGWGECTDGLQTRVCDREIARCSIIIGEKPDEKRVCQPDISALLNINANETTNVSTNRATPRNFITGAVIGAVSQNKNRAVGLLVVLFILFIVFSFIVGRIRKKRKIKSQVS